ncbi:hypothetical protein CDD81_1357 [Ophiocordyceps australis]|uniref:Uncharacterized protein n=1 Tax=Ophiocordyceps australis TaxID=1399860 RepID=A0A2C5Y1B4_9HYPO|nr:hypothetical protein CDD81_1357 [Ophiocordyceps australis]
METRMRKMAQAGKKGRLVVANVESGLTKISDQDVRQLTRLLFIDERQGDREWLDSQEEQMKQLPACLRRPRGLISRLAIRMAQHGAPFWPEAARLCMMHKQLDARVIRRVMALVANECVMHTNRLRGLRRHKHGMEPAVRCWLDRVDSLTSLWMGKGLFEQVFGREPETGMRPRGPTAERDRCEACMLAVFGTDTQALVDTRASLVARYASQRRRRRRTRQPRLLRVVEAWIDNFDEALAGMIRLQSESLAPSIARLRSEWREERERRRALHPRRGSPVGWAEVTREGLPVPRRNMGLVRDARGKPLAQQRHKLTRANMEAHLRMSTTAVFAGSRRRKRRGVLDDNEARRPDVHKWLAEVAEAEARQDDEEDVAQRWVCVDADYYEYVGGTPVDALARSQESLLESSSSDDEAAMDGYSVASAVPQPLLYAKEEGKRVPAASCCHDEGQDDDVASYYFAQADEYPEARRDESRGGYGKDDDDARLLHDLQQCGIGVEGLEGGNGDDEDEALWSSSVYSSEGGAPPLGNWI